jgi:hypothetical protein
VASIHNSAATLPILQGQQVQQVGLKIEKLYANEISELSVLSAPLLTQLQLQPPLPVSAGEQKTISSAAAVNVLGKEEKKNRQIYVRNI